MNLPEFAALVGLGFSWHFFEVFHWFCNTSVLTFGWEYPAKSLLLENILIPLSLWNVIARGTLLTYCKRYPKAANALMEWYHEIVSLEFSQFHQLKEVYGNASIISDDRVVFNIMGNRFRLVVRVVFSYKTIQIKWFGSHAEYDRIDAATVSFKK